MAFLCYIQFALKCRHRYCYRTFPRLCKGTSKKAAWVVPEMKPSCNLWGLNLGPMVLMHQKWRNHMDSPYVKQQLTLAVSYDILNLESTLPETNIL